MEALLPGGSFTGWGWGSSMQDTEMVIFSADGENSIVSTYYSSGFKDPDPDPTLTACYNWSKYVNEDSSVKFFVTRPLDCGIESSYVVELDTDLSLIAAWNPDSPELSYHSKNRLEFVQMLGSDG
jgi:hypothetical protein